MTTSILGKTEQESLTYTQREIKRKICRFDLASLLNLLKHLGYQEKEIYFQANTSLSSPPSLCEDIWFSEQGYPRVTILINLGLLSGNSPLPNFFQKKMDTGSINPILFARYVNFFDHLMISTLLSVNMAENNHWFFTDWKTNLHQYLRLLALNSLSTLTFLFQICFPEIQVDGMKFPRIMNLQSASTIIGKCSLGKETFLGKNEKLTSSSLRIHLIIDALQADISIPWAFVINQRLKDLIFPLLERVHIYLQVILIVKNCKDAALLSGASHLGYCSLGSSHRSLKFLLFAGYPQDLLHKKFSQVIKI
jgi:hypothetical protein